MSTVSRTVRSTARLAVILLVVTLSAGCPKKKPEELPPEPPPGAAPIDTLLELLGLERSELTLPRAEQADYQLPVRYPVIDAALNRPLSLPSCTRLPREGSELLVQPMTCASHRVALHSTARATGERRGRMPSCTACQRRSVAAALP